MSSNEDLKQAVVKDLLEIVNKSAACRAKMQLMNPLSPYTTAVSALKKAEKVCNELAMEVNRWPV